MITTYIAYAPKEEELNLGRQYNKLVEASPTEWVCFLDHDAMWLTRDWYHDLCEAAKHGEREGIGLFGCMTNRIGNKQQRVGGGATHDIVRMRETAALRHELYRNTESAYQVTTEPLSGVVMLISKTAHRKMGGFAEGFLGVDWDACRRVREAGMKVALMHHVMVYHWYRADGDKAHVKMSHRLHKNPYC